MKKNILICIMIFTLLCFVASCDLQGSVETDQQTTAETNKLAIAGDNAVSGDSNIDIDPVFVVLTDINEYRKYIAQHEMPNDFIAYEKISSVGEFSSLTFRESHFNYHYELVDKNDFIIVMSVSRLQPGEDLISGDVSGREVLRPDKLETVNVVFNKKCANKIVLFNDIKYNYDLEGTLKSISFIAGEYKITFEAGSVYNAEEGKYDQMSFADYTPETENVLTMLLSGNENNVSIESILDVKTTD